MALVSSFSFLSDKDTLRPGELSSITIRDLWEALQENACSTSYYMKASLPKTLRCVFFICQFPSCSHYTPHFPKQENSQSFVFMMVALPKSLATNHATALLPDNARGNFTGVQKRGGVVAHERRNR